VSCARVDRDLEGSTVATGACLPAAICHPPGEDRRWRRTGPPPSVKQLQEEYTVGRDTVLRAVEILRAEGVVFTVPRRGTYVSPDAK
jgi:hypothetical protein